MDAGEFERGAEAWLAARPEIASLRAAVCDLNGCFRGKRLPVADAGKALRGAMRLPLSVVSQDIWGRDAEGTPALEAGDGDGICRPTGRGPLSVDWLEAPSALLPMWMFCEDGSPSPIDPRQALAAVLDRYRAAGLTPVVATELEFYLVEAERVPPLPPEAPATGERLFAEGVLSLDDVDRFEGFFADIDRAAAGNGIPVDTAIAEGGTGQFEINLRHVDDPLRAADDAAFFKRLVRGTARRHGLAASFMAKPYQERAGCGFHVHFSLLDGAGRNVFDDGTAAGSEAMRAAVAGVLEAMAPCALVFAPHLNSCRRLTPGSHAPTGICWAYENRFAALRIPGGPGAARRIEHRVAGADANPYLVLAAILGAGLDGIENGLTPPGPVEGNVYELDLPQLPASWEKAIDLFEGSAWPGRVLGAELAAVLAAVKRQELQRFAARMSEFELKTYLEVV